MQTTAMSAYIQNLRVSPAMPIDHSSVSTSFVVTVVILGINPIRTVIARVIPVDHLTALPQSD